MKVTISWQCGIDCYANNISGKVSKIRLAESNTVLRKHSAKGADTMQKHGNEMQIPQRMEKEKIENCEN